MKFDVRGDVSGIIQHLTATQREKIPAAMVRALNKTATAVRAEAVKRVRDERALKAAVVRDAIAIKRANRARMTAEVIATGRPIPLREYGANQTRLGVTVRVTPKGGRKLIQRNGNHAFMVGRYGNHVYIREGKKRLPIKKLYGPSIPTAFIKGAVMKAIDVVGRATFPKRFHEEAKYELSKR